MDLERLKSGLVVVKGTLDYVAATKSVPVAEARLRDAIADLFAETEAEVVRQLQAQGIPTNDSERGRITAAVGKDAQRYRTAVAEAAKEAAREGSQAVTAILQAAGIPVTRDVLSDFTLAKLETMVFEASDKTIARLVGDINGALVDAINTGAGVDQVAADLKAGVFTDMKTYEATRVARTEINSAQNWGAFQTLRDYSPYSMWWTAGDGLVRTFATTGGRADHVRLNGQIVRTGQPFENGLKFPGDRMGPLLEWINCRCRILPYIMPSGYTAPIGRPYFKAADLVKLKGV